MSVFSLRVRGLYGEGRERLPIGGTAILRGGYLNRADFARFSRKNGRGWAKSGGVGAGFTHQPVNCGLVFALWHRKTDQLQTYPAPCCECFDKVSTNNLQLVGAYPKLWMHQ